MGSWLTEAVAVAAAVPAAAAVAAADVAAAVAAVFVIAAVQQSVIVTEMPPEAFIFCAVCMTFHSLYDSCAFGHLSCLT